MPIEAIKNSQVLIFEDKAAVVKNHAARGYSTNARMGEYKVDWPVNPATWRIFFLGSIARKILSFGHQTGPAVFHSISERMVRYGSSTCL
jgi:hypothetical protein